MSKYRIAWKSIRIGATGHGSGIFTEEEAADIIAGYELPDELKSHGLKHWFEKVPTPAPPDQR